MAPTAGRLGISHLPLVTRLSPDVCRFLQCPRLGRGMPGLAAAADSRLLLPVSIRLDDRFRNSMAIADGACAARSRREEEDDALPSSTTTNEEIARNPRLPNGLRARVRTQTLSCADEHLRYIQFDLWAQQLSCYFGIDHLDYTNSLRKLRLNRVLHGEVRRSPTESRS